MTQILDGGHVGMYITFDLTFKILFLDKSTNALINKRILMRKAKHDYKEEARPARKLFY